MKEQIIIYEVRNGAFLPKKISIEELTERINSNNLDTDRGVSKFFLRKHQAYNYLNKFKDDKGFPVRCNNA
jgi:hypothetical protein|tara:strand:- start:901 stop:1113 length:213 start_codon:yes stop_codon:yes gene_type:complete